MHLCMLDGSSGLAFPHLCGKLVMIVSGITSQLLRRDDGAIVRGFQVLRTTSDFEATIY
jgi:hypothetical protein